MPELNDKTIRQALLSHLSSSQRPPRALLEEVRVHNGNAIADVVEIGEHFHCYEIKGETDVVRRIAHQGHYYDQVFPYVTLVTTSNHFSRASEIAPAHWGLMIAETSGTGATAIREVRKATANTRFDKELALLTLWKSELLSLFDDAPSKAQQLSRKALTQILAHNRIDVDVSRMISEKLADRHANASWSIAM